MLKDVLVTFIIYLEQETSFILLVFFVVLVFFFNKFKKKTKKHSAFWVIMTNLTLEIQFTSTEVTKLFVFFLTNVIKEQYYCLFCFGFFLFFKKNRLQMVNIYISI